MYVLETEEEKDRTIQSSSSDFFEKKPNAKSFDSEMIGKPLQ